MAHYQNHPLANPRTAQRFLEQRKIWVDRNLESVKIKDMDQDYLFSTMTWLLKRAEELKFAQELQFVLTPGPQGEMAEFEVNQEYQAFLAQAPRLWMRERPLFQRMIERYRKLGQFSPQKITMPLVEAVDDRGY